MKRSPLKRKTPLRKRSAKKAKLDREYTKLRKQYLEDNPICEWWLAENGFDDATVRFGGAEGLIIVHKNKGIVMVNEAPPSVEIHHVRGRVGALLNDTNFWMAVSREGHDAIHQNPKRSYELGYMKKR